MMKKAIFIIIALVLSLNTNAQTTAKGYYRGDINGDSKVDIQDMALFINVLNGKRDATAPCDIDDNDKVDLTDLEYIKYIILNNYDISNLWVETTIDYGGKITDDNAPTVVEGKKRATSSPKEEGKK